jgi:hypothetical protein
MHSNHPVKMKIWNHPEFGTIEMTSRGAAWAVSEKVVPVVEEINREAVDLGLKQLDPEGPK